MYTAAGRRILSETGGMKSVPRKTHYFLWGFALPSFR